MSEQVVTDQLRQWIIEQDRAGCRHEDILASMRVSGWTAEVAAAALHSTLQPAAGHALAAASAVALPEPALAGSPSRIWADDRWVGILLTLQHPRLVLLGGFLSDDECDALVLAAAPRMARSETVVDETGGSEITAARTSQGMFFSRGETPLCQRIEARIAVLLNWPVVNGEGLQVLHYLPGAEYKPHHDYFDPAQPGMAAVLVAARAKKKAGGTSPPAEFTSALLKGHGVQEDRSC